MPLALEDLLLAERAAGIKGSRDSNVSGPWTCPLQLLRFPERFLVRGLDPDKDILEIGEGQVA